MITHENNPKRSTTRIHIKPRERLLHKAAQLLQPYLELDEISESLVRDEKSRKAIKQGIQVLEQFIKAHPRNYSALFLLGKSYRLLEDYDKSYGIFKKLFKRQRRNPQVAAEHALGCLHAERIEESVGIAEYTHALYPKNASLSSILAICYLMVQKNTDALKLSEVAVSMEPENQFTKIANDFIWEVVSGKRPQPKSSKDLP